MSNFHETVRLYTIACFQNIDMDKQAAFEADIKALFLELIKDEALSDPEHLRGCKKHYPDFTAYCLDCDTLKEYWRGYHVALKDVSQKVEAL